MISVLPCNLPAVVHLVKRTARHIGSSRPHTERRVFLSALPACRETVGVAHTQREQGLSKCPSCLQGGSKGGTCREAVSASGPQPHSFATHGKSTLSICLALVPAVGTGGGSDKQNPQSCLDKEEVTLRQNRTAGGC